MQAMLPSAVSAVVTLTLGSFAGFSGATVAQVALAPAAAPRATPDASAQTAMADEAPIVDADERAPAGPRRIHRAADGMFYVTAQVNGHPVRFLVDTGANVVVLREADAIAAGAAPAGRYGAHAATAGGATAMAWTSLDEVQVAGRSVRGIRAAVVRRGLAVSLLGQNMLSRLGAVRFEGNALDLG